jgi:hypothetical protein
MDLVDKIAEAIARMEGFYKPGSLAQRNNNPGNLRSWGSRPVSGGYAVFETPEAGWAALKQQIRRNIDRGLNLLEFFGGKPGVYAGYSPAADKNDPVAYARFVAQRAGIDVTTPLKELLAGGSQRP